MADRCRTHLLSEKWLIVESQRIGQTWKDRLTLNNRSTINLHAKTLRTLVVELSQRVLERRDLRYVDSMTTQMLIRKIVFDLRESKQLQYFDEVQNLDSLATLLNRTISDLRLADLDSNAILNSARSSGFELNSKTDDLQRVMDEYTRRLAARKQVDYPGCLRIVTAGILDGSIALPNELAILFPEEVELRQLELQLLAAFSTQSALLAYSGSSSQLEYTQAQVSEAAQSKAVAFRYFSGLGESNEVRRAFQCIHAKSSTQQGLDTIELLHTDYNRYVPVIVEQLSTWLSEKRSNFNEAENNATKRDSIVDVDQLPVTFAEGIACVYSRPGRALRSWIRWLRSDFLQVKMVQMIREGLLAKPDSERPVGYSRLSNILRAIPIGFQLERYLPQIDAAMANAAAKTDEYHRKVASGESEADDRGPDWDAGQSAIRTMREMIAPIVALVPSDTDNAVQVLQKARQFLRQCTRADSKLDRSALAQLIDHIDVTIESIGLTNCADLDVYQWLEDLPIESRILASGPQPGRVHVTNLAAGGYTGRDRLFILGLDESRYPRRIAVDPILLDSERQSISEHLPTSESRNAKEQQALMLTLNRAIENGADEVNLSFSIRNLAEDRPQYPSPALLQLYRLTNTTNAEMTDLLTAIGTEESFVNANVDTQLSTHEFALSQLLVQRDVSVRNDWIEANYPHFRQSRLAYEALAQPNFGDFDGLVPAAGVELDPSNVQQRLSASRLETFGTCPRRYFFKYGLKVFPPDQCDVDPDRWLDALQFGSLVHEVFEEFLRGHTEKDLLPNYDRDRSTLLEILQSKIEAQLMQLPARNQDAYLRECQELKEICDIFLHEEETYCKNHNAKPWILEASIGLKEQTRNSVDCPDPIELRLSDGRLLHMGGRIDRIDRLMIHGSERYAIWDYKSGSAWGFDETDPFQGGRKLQPFLYLGMLRHRISKIGGQRDSVASFGYFFPSPKTEGRRIQWTHSDLRDGDAVLRNIYDLIQRGAFIATNEPNDCAYCDYQSICGEAKQVTQQAKSKALDQSNRKLLLPWIELRDLKEK